MFQFATPLPDRLDTLSAISRAMSATLDLRALCETIDREIGRVMDATLFSIAILEANGTTLWLPYVREEGRVFRDARLPYGDNVTSVVIREGQPLRFHTHREYRQFAERHGLPVLNVGEDQGEAVLFVPLHTGDRCLGVLSVESFQPAVYSDEDVDTLSIIAAQAAVAIENAELFARNERSVRQMGVLLDVARTINGSLDLVDVLDAILTSMQHVLPYAFAAVLLPNEANGTLDIMDSVGPAVRSRSGPILLPTLRIPFGQGISGQVYQSGTPLVVPDVRLYPGFVDHGLEGVLCELAVPLCWNERVVGVLDLGREGTDAFTEEDVGVVSLFATQAAAAIENARLYQEQRQRVEELQMIESIVQRLQPLHDPRAITRLIIEELKQLIDYHTCRLYRMDPDGLSLLPLDSEGGRTPAGALPIEHGFAGWIAREGRADRIANTLDDPRPAHIPGTPRVEESMLGAPLIYEGQVQGVIVLSKPGRNQFDENAQQMLQIIATQVAIGVHRARLYQALHTEARTDGLVRLWNRRHVLERFRGERTRAARSRRPLMAIMLDIDRFKQVNDTHGHDAGDMVLREVASVLRDGVRTEDIVARYGGEEFLVLLPECPLPDAVALAHRLCRAVAAHPLPEEAGVDRVTVSAGVAAWQPSDTGEELFSRADAAMYRAKALGGDTVAVAGE